MATKAEPRFKQVMDYINKEEFGLKEWRNYISEEDSTLERQNGLLGWQKIWVVLRVLQRDFEKLNVRK